MMSICYHTQQGQEEVYTSPFRTKCDSEKSLEGRLRRNAKSCSLAEACQPSFLFMALSVFWHAYRPTPPLLSVRRIQIIETQVMTACARAHSATCHTSSWEERIWKLLGSLLVADRKMGTGQAWENLQAITSRPIQETEGKKLVLTGLPVPAKTSKVFLAPHVFCVWHWVIPGSKDGRWGVHRKE